MVNISQILGLKTARNAPRAQNQMLQGAVATLQSMFSMRAAVTAKLVSIVTKAAAQHAKRARPVKYRVTRDRVAAKVAQRVDTRKRLV